MRDLREEFPVLFLHSLVEVANTMIQVSILGSATGIPVQ